ncbi:MAG: hypothetical protein ACTSPB_12645, partial [Candidatus Thorarchaeota archaeon]
MSLEGKLQTMLLRSLNLSGTVISATKAGTTNVINALIYDGNRKILVSTGTEVPTATTSGFAKGALHIDTNVEAGTNGLYENIGSTTSCNFNRIGDITEAEIAIADGKVLIGNASGVAAAITLSGDITMTNAGVVTISDDKIGNAELVNTHIQYATVEVSSAEIKALNATPKTLVAAQGVNTVIELISLTMFLDYGSVAYDSNGILGVYETDSTGVLVSDTVALADFLAKTADTIKFV